MITYQCGCGGQFQIDENAPLRQVACPWCGHQIRMARIRSLLQTIGDGVIHTRKAVGIGLGLLILATLVIPWSVRGREVTWSYQALESAFRSPGPRAALLVGSWAVGFLAVVLGIALRRAPLAAAYLLLGAAGAGLIGYATDSLLRPRPDWDRLRSIGTMVWLTRYPTAIAFLVFTGLRARLGRGPLVSLLQAASSAAMVACLALPLKDLVEALTELVPQVRAAAPAAAAEEGIGWLTSTMCALIAQIGLVSVLGTLALAAVVSFVHALLFFVEGRGAARFALFLAWFAWFDMAILFGPFWAIKSAVEIGGSVFDALGPALGAFNLALILFAVVFLGVEGTGGLVAGITSRARSAAPALIPA